MSYSHCKYFQKNKFRCLDINSVGQYEKGLLPSLALIRALFATMLSISMLKCVFVLKAVPVYLSKAAVHPVFMH